MNHEDAEDFTPEENLAFANVIHEAYGEEAIEQLEHEANKAVFDNAVAKTAQYLRQATDTAAQYMDIHVVACALALLSKEYDELVEGEDSD